MKNKGFFTSVLIIAATVSLLGCGKAKTDTVSDTGMASAEAGSSALPVEQKQSDDENVKQITRHSLPKIRKQNRQKQPSQIPKHK